MTEKRDTYMVYGFHSGGGYESPLGMWWWASAKEVFERAALVYLKDGMIVTRVKSSLANPFGGTTGEEYKP